MARLAPFSALHYNQERVGALDPLITQPYDKITPEMQIRYYERHPNNYVRLILSRDPDPYLSAQEVLNDWLKERILIKDEHPGIYLYHQRFSWAGKEFIRKGFVALCELEEFASGTILPHEWTHKRPKEDRLRLMRAIRLNSEQIFLLYPDPEGRVDEILRPYYQARPLFEATDEYGVVHLVWWVTEPQIIKRVQNFMLDKVLIIADGHHRYETSLNYRNEQRQLNPNYSGEEGFNYRMLTLVSLSDPGLLILPTHRILKGVDNFARDKFLARAQLDFAIEAAAPSRLVTSLPTHRIGFYCGGDEAWILSLKHEDRLKTLLPERSPAYRSLDVTVLHTLLLEGVLGIGVDRAETHITYEREAERAIEAVRVGEYQACFLLSPTRAEEIQEITRNRERLPQKSTDFYPKLASGLLAFDLSDAVIAGT